MEKGLVQARFDGLLGLEAYRFSGLARPFPNHFHDHYVVGLVERGERRLNCGERVYSLAPGDILLLNPGDSHSCVQQSEEPLDYLALNISRVVMAALSAELAGTGEEPVFFQAVVKDCELACCLRRLHQKIMENADEFERSEALLTVFSRLLEGYSLPAAQMETPDSREEVEAVCAYLQRHYAQRITLEQLCALTGMSRSTLFRVFTRVKGVTPYRYLESIRVHQAQKLLEQGMSPVDAALATGFSDQSHFTNFFHQLTGLTPGAYRDLRSKGK